MFDLVVGGWWLVVGGWWLVAGGWWLVVGVRPVTFSTKIRPLSVRAALFELLSYLPLQLRQLQLRQLQLRSCST